MVERLKPPAVFFFFFNPENPSISCVLGTYSRRYRVMMSSRDVEKSETENNTKEVLYLQEEGDVSKIKTLVFYLSVNHFNILQLAHVC